jgi:anhydro-N-acetylmuramic acid kinase
MDGVDAVLAEIDSTSVNVLAHHAETLAPALKANLDSLALPGKDHVDLLGETDHRLGLLFAEAANNLLKKNNLKASDIRAIGSHGQTVRHRPSGDTPFTLQIADPNLIAARTGIVTVADFRRKDMAYGGQGAPLVPAFHQALFHQPDSTCAVVNIGGIANITWLPASGPVIGFDTGPGNGLMDAWIQRHKNKPFDDKGQWASGGEVNKALLAALEQHPFLSQPAPKSTGREDFNLTWLLDQLAGFGDITAQDVQATLASYTANTICLGLLQTARAAPLDTVYLCGGGARNLYLVELLKSTLVGTTIRSTAERNIDPQHIEGAAFAWLAYRRLQQLPGVLASVTGARRDSISGAIYLPD